MLRVDALTKTYAGTPVFQGVSLQVRAGEFVALLGESGVGKSTLLNCIAGLDEADAGCIELDGVEIGPLAADDRARLRREKLGFVFQAFHVLPHLNVAENVELPLRLLGTSWRAGRRESAAARVEELLVAVGLGGLGERLPAQLSGGQLQRVAIARALAHRPALILADEPTGNLDRGTADGVFDLMLQLARERGMAFVVVTHDRSLASYFERSVHLSGPVGAQL